jgi:hypothetical protein
VTFQLPFRAHHRERRQRDELSLVNREMRARPDLSEEMLDRDPQEIGIIARQSNWIAAEDLAKPRQSLFVTVVAHWSFASVLDRKGNKRFEETWTR